MADTTFVSKVTVIARAWLQDVNDFVYRGTTPISVFRFMTAAQIAEVQAYTVTTNPAAMTASLQAAIAYGIANGRNIYMPAGYYKINSSLLMYLASTLITVNLIGENASAVAKGTIIDHTGMLTTPAIILQGGRDCKIQNITFLGPNTATPTTLIAASQWTVAGVRDQRYSPQCAIAVDPFATGGVPADGGYPGYSAYYASTALASSQTIIKGCRFYNQVVGIFNGNLVGANNDNNVYDELFFYTCKVCISFGQIEMKGCVIRSLFANLIYTVIDTYTYSDRNGSAGFLWTGGDVSSANSLFRTLSQVGANNAETQNWKIEGVYAEGLWTIAYVGDTANFASIPGEFDSCFFWFTGIGTVRVDANLVNFAPLKFNNCAFWSPTLADNQKGYAMKFYHESKASSGQKSYLTFDSCRFMTDTMPLFPNADLADVEMKNCTGHSTTGTAAFKTTFSNRLRVNTLNDITSQAPIWPGAIVENKDTGESLYVKQGMNTVSLGNITITVAGFNATFTAADATTLQVGDVIYQTNHLINGIGDTTFTAATWPLGVVTIAATSAITVEDVSQNASSGSKALSLNWYPRMHGYSQVITHTSTTAEVSSSGNAVVWAVGDRIIAADIPAGTYLASGTAPNFVLSKAATATNPAHRCYDADWGPLVYSVSDIWPTAPAISFATPGDLVVVYAAGFQFGYYEKRGDLVTIWVDLITTTFTHTTSVGNLQINNLPFPAKTLTGFTQLGGGLGWQGITKAGYTDINPYILSGGSVILFYASGSGVAGANIGQGDMPTGGNVQLIFSLSYVCSTP